MYINISISRFHKREDKAGPQNRLLVVAQWALRNDPITGFDPVSNVTYCGCL
jgi:hypothetical protein